MQRRAVVLEPEEKKVYTLMQQIQTIKKEKDRKRKGKQAERKAMHAQKVAKEDAKRLENEKKRRKEFFRKEGLAEKKRGASGVSPSDVRKSKKSKVE